MMRLLVLISTLVTLSLPGFTQTGLTELSAEKPKRPDGHLATIIRRGKLVVGVKTDYAPWGFINENGDIAGLEIDLAQDLADRLGVDLEVTGVTAANRIDRVNQKRVDVVIATAGDTAERRNQTDLIQPNYYSSGVVVYGRKDLGVKDWGDLRGKKICLNRSAYYNRALEETYDIDGQYFSGRREALLALNYQRCAGWAFDDTALERYTRDNPSDTFDVLVKPILEIPWAIMVPQGEGNRTLGRFVSDMVGEWHATGRILQLQSKWNIEQTDFVKDLNQRWTMTADGKPVCARNPKTGRHPEMCIDSAPYQSAPDIALTGWMAVVKEKIGLDFGVFASDYERNRLLRGLGIPLALSGLAIIGALIVGISFAALGDTLGRWGFFGRVLLAPQTVLITVARMTPPILQLYIVFFGLGGAFLASPELTPGAFLIACAIFSFYAGAANAVMLSYGLEQERGHHPKKGTFALLPGAISRSFDGLVAACVNIVKAAGLASAIAVGEIVSSVNLVVAEGGDVTTLMNGLLVFYFVLVTLVIWLFRRAKVWVMST